MFKSPQHTRTHTHREDTLQAAADSDEDDGGEREALQSGDERGDEDDGGGDEDDGGKRRHLPPSCRSFITVTVRYCYRPFSHGLTEPLHRHSSSYCISPSSSSSAPQPPLSNFNPSCAASVCDWVYKRVSPLGEEYYWRIKILYYKGTILHWRCYFSKRALSLYQQ